MAVNKEQIFGMAEKEMEYRVELFNKLTHTCFNKCVEKRYKDPELNMGENSCIDRCVSKYWQVALEFIYFFLLYIFSFTLILELTLRFLANEPFKTFIIHFGTSSMSLVMVLIMGVATVWRGGVRALLTISAII
ncbi:hypothetical protein LguiA_012020 [Lonicera macranthoides]